MTVKWRRELANRSRGNGVKNTLPRITIFCEAENTEFLYMRAFEAEFGHKGIVVKVVRGEGKLGKMLKSAAALAGDRNRTKAGIDQVWCVIDHDGREGIDDKRREAVNNNVRVAFSNPCFELWALYHFDSGAGICDCGALQKRLKTFMPSYDHERGAVLDFDQLKPLYQAARINAHKSCEDRVREGSPNGNPSTDVYVLLDLILSSSRAPENYLKHQGKF